MPGVVSPSQYATHRNQYKIDESLTIVHARLSLWEVDDMKKLLIAALLGCAAMPAQAIDYITYEAWGSATGYYVVGQNEQLQFYGFDVGQSYATATFAVGGASCYFGQYACSRSGNSITWTNQGAYYFTFTLTFDAPLTDFPTTADGFVGGTVSTRADIPYVDDWGGEGFGKLDQLKVTLWSSDQYQLPTASAYIRAVPEPATWAMMIAGFGLTGVALRRRRATVQFA